VGVIKVEFYAGGNLVFTDTAAPYSFSLNPASYPNGALTLTARAYDAKNNVGQASRSVTIQNAPPPPAVNSTAAVVSPANGTVVAGTVTIQASATMGAAIARVDFYVNNAVIGSRTSQPYSLAWNTVNSGDGAKSLHVRAVDVNGQTVTSAPVSVTVSNSFAGDTIAPSVSFISPANSQTVSGMISVQVAAADNVGVTKVELYYAGYLVATRTTAPYTFSLFLRSGIQGLVLTAKAYDAAGNTSSASVTINTQ
jgi:hypothetical protein